MCNRDGRWPSKPKMLIIGPFPEKFPDPCSKARVSSFQALAENPSVVPYHSQDKVLLHHLTLPVTQP